MSTVTETAWYVFGVVDSSVELAGLDVIPHGSLAAVAATVPLSEFGEAELARQLEDDAWIVSRAREHEDVLERVQRVTTIVPFRFGAIYHDVEGVRAMLAEREDELGATLARLKGCVEIGVKLWADRGRLEPARGPAISPGASGREYLERLRTGREDARTVAQQLFELAQAAHARLLGQAVDGVSNPPQRRELTGRTDWMILNGAYLVSDGGERLYAEIERLQRDVPEGVTIESTGPWPPHNFVDPPEDE